ncbi:MAG: leucyl aminopeptidase [Bryobacteraceae bacterium]
MQLLIQTSAATQTEADAFAVLAFETENGRPPADSAHAEQNGWLAELRASGEFTGRLYETAVLHRPAGLAAKRLVVIGAGKADKISTVELRRIAGTLVRSLKGKGARSIALLLEGDLASEEHVLAASEGAVVGGWEPDKYKSDTKKESASPQSIDSFTVVVPGGGNSSLAAALERGRIIAESQNFTRDLVNEPANKLTPAVLAEAARLMAAEEGLAYEVLDREEMTRLGMGSLLGVAVGSAEPPFLIVVKYKPARPKAADQLALVGKGVTFDTGGNSIKPADGMEKMKYDMAGAAAVLGAMRALAQLKPPVAVTAYVPTVENMVSDRAQRPGDIVTAMSGKTIEVLNTDAEGRLILADALTYANRNGATHIVDAATLTGAIGVALGQYNIGAFTNNQDLLNKFLAAATSAGEKTWQLPMDEEYKEYLKCAYADLPNIGSGRQAGSITAAWFLREFADPTPWVHLDIAATAWLDDGKSWISKGPTGVAVRSFVDLAMKWS